MSKHAGFTLLEILLSISLVSVLAGIIAPAFLSYQTRNDLDVAVSTFAQTLQRAQTLSQSVERDSTWGVSIQTHSIILFKGESYATRDAGFDERFNIATVIAVTGTTEFVFAKLTGDLNATSTTTTFSTLNNQSRTVTVNKKGVISF